AIPPPLPAIDIPPITIDSVASLFENLPTPKRIPQPTGMEQLGQDYGLILYRTTLIGPRSGNLNVTDLHDYGLVYVNGAFVDTIDRTKNERTVRLPETADRGGTLDILVEAMGRVNFGEHLLDRKGITQRVTLRGVTLMKWQAFNLPMDPGYLRSLKFSSRDTSDSPRFFNGSFHLNETGDTFLDLSRWTKGVVWVNGHHLGRYWNIGPQQRLFVPAPWLKKGRNEVTILDLYLKSPALLKGTQHMNDVGGG
ncbi:MAG TPA: beta galactosidase jelly roll domain-containing protein, partial [Bacteroidota bacterium]|nr:beta galactosidase jelly roll domain-containing protein [Bacteroidota bacterium]